VGVDAGGNMVVAGEFSGELSLDSQTTLSSTGGIDIFVAKFDGQGNHRWSKRFGDSIHLQSSVRVAVQLLGNVAIAGFFEGSIDFGGGSITSSGAGHDLFVAKFDPKGDFLWSKHFPVERQPCDPSDCQQDRIDLAVDSLGDLVLTGHFAGSVDFGGTNLSSNGGTDVFVAKLDAEDGGLLWSASYGDEKPQCTSPDCLVAAAIDHGDQVVLAGYFDATIDFGVGVHKSAGEHDAFVLKLGP
jgi:outer membrane protein assembly factor BamB